MKKSFWTKFAEWCGKIAASYRENREQQRAASRAVAQQNLMNQRIAIAAQYKPTVEEIVYSAISNCASTIRAVIPRNSASFFCDPPIVVQDGLVGFAIRYYRKSEYPIDRVRRTLERELTFESHERGLPAPEIRGLMHGADCMTTMVLIWP